MGRERLVDGRKAEGRGSKRWRAAGQQEGCEKIPLGQRALAVSISHAIAGSQGTGR